MKKKAAIFINAPNNIDYVFAMGRLDQVKELTDLYPEFISSANFDQHVDKLQDVEVIFSTWGMVKLTEEQIDKLPSLKAVFYAAGATGGFAVPLLNKKIRLFSAWTANAIPVAEFCVGQILLAAKGFFQNTIEFSSPEGHGNAHRGNGIFDESVAFIGAGAIAQKTIEMLKPYQLKPVVIPSREENRTISLEEAFKTCYIISNHLPDRDDNAGVINGEHFRSMRHGSTFINTGRGKQVNEAEMIEVLKERKDIIALLDVTYPEPPEADSELYTLPNVFLSSHIAGSINNEVVRMADYMIEEFKIWEKGEEVRYEVFEHMIW